MSSIMEVIYNRLNKDWSDSGVVLGLAVVGAITTLTSSARCCAFLWKYFVRPFPSLKKSYGGGWALITGGTAGIGLEIAKCLVSEGINVILIARGEKGLNAAAQELASLNPLVEIRTVSMDCSFPSELDYALKKALHDIESVGMLFNNVGVHNHLPTNVEEMTSEEVDRIISVNCNFQVQITRLLIPKLKLAAKVLAKKAIVVNISSLTSHMVMPMLATYAATKAFEEHWSVNLAAELEPHKIEVICLRPGITVSRMSGISTPSFICPSAKTMARSCLRMIGCGEQSVAPYWPHAMLDVVNGMVPDSVAWSIVRDMHQDKREKLLKEQ